MKTLIYTTATALFLPVVTLAHEAEEGYMMNWGGMMGGGGVFALLTWLVWLIVGILVIVWLVQQISKK